MRNLIIKVVLISSLSVLFFACEKANDGVSDDQQNEFVKLYGSSLNQTPVDVIFDHGVTYLLSTTETSEKGKDIQLKILDNFGNERSSIEYGDSLDEVAGGFIKANSGSLYIVGTKEVEDDSLDIYLLKVNTEGAILLEAVLPGIQNQEGQGICEIGDGRFMIVGSTKEKTNASAEREGNPAGVKDVLIEVVEESDTEFERVFREKSGGANDDEAFDVIKQGSSSFLVGGHTNSFNKPGTGGQDVFALEVSYAGVEQSVDYFGTDDDDDYKSLVKTSTGDVFVMYNAEGENTYYFKLSDGEVINLAWTQELVLEESGVDNNGYGINELRNGNLGIIGYQQATGGNKDLMFYEFEPVEGNKVSSSKIEGPGAEIGYFIKDNSESTLIYGSSGFENNEMLSLYKIQIQK